MQNELAVVDMPRVDDLATVCVGSDRYPARVTSVSPSGHQVTMAKLDYHVISGSAHDGSAKYRIDAHPQRLGASDRATRRRDGAYRLAGWASGGRVYFGFAEAYRDPSF